MQRSAVSIFFWHLMNAYFQKYIRLKNSINKASLLTENIFNHSSEFLGISDGSNVGGNQGDSSDLRCSRLKRDDMSINDLLNIGVQVMVDFYRLSK